MVCDLHLIKAVTLKNVNRWAWKGEEKIDIWRIDSCHSFIYLTTVYRCFIMSGTTSDAVDIGMNKTAKFLVFKVA